MYLLKVLQYCYSNNTAFQEPPFTVLALFFLKFIMGRETQKQRDRAWEAEIITCRSVTVQGGNKHALMLLALSTAASAEENSTL